MLRASVDAKLVLYFTHGVSLKTWEDAGMLEREVSLYRLLRPHLQGVAFVTYGDEADSRIRAELPGIRVIYNRWRMPKQWYVRLVSWFLPWVPNGAVIVKSNQVQGAEVAQRAARRYGKPFVARCGYLPSSNAARLHGSDSVQTLAARDLERRVFTGADRVVVTSDAIKETILQRYQIAPERIRVIPNYVDTTVFVPVGIGLRSSKQLAYVGRLDPEKNPAALIEAIKGLDVELLIIGNGSLSEQLRREVEHAGLPVRFLGNVPNQQLPSILNSTAAFVMPSLLEGHPKALLEAMACGLPVIGTDVPGIREVIQHRLNGYLCGTSPDEIRSAIREVLADPALRGRMGVNAREYVVQSCSLDKIMRMELELIQELVMST
jgi:glycosyltransferase involved in cell wall biosynthesis